MSSKAILKPKGGRWDLQRKVAIAIPASVVSDVPHLREKTAKVGLIGRAAAIFRINEVIVFSDNPQQNQTRELNLVTLLLSYMETPQYLRRRLFKLEPELRYAGILPPLRTAHHPLNRMASQLKEGEFREGVTLSTGNEGTLADIGVERPVIIPGNRLALGNRVTLKIMRTGRRVEAELASREDALDYWGYSVTAAKTLGRVLKSDRFDLMIATSKYGVRFSDAVEEISAKWKRSRSILVAFGAPNQGLLEIARSESFDLESTFDFVINSVPSQGTETVRTEEALIASLAILNFRFQG
jgi:predicted SPOUT superfamily RNA methylase MTH1